MVDLVYRTLLEDEDETLSLPSSLGRALLKPLQALQVRSAARAVAQRCCRRPAPHALPPAPPAQRPSPPPAALRPVGQAAHAAH
jgi:hypothetical protein